ncbi:MAG: Fic family protein [Acidobacteria bacterium]|nr:Fic family protein [Acidobacteriota bacterium]MBS1867228.1 Fic family protein [Acidobacteriota bacterium]
MNYIYLSKDWPQFTWNAGRLVGHLSATRYEQGMLLGRMKDLGYQLKNEATLTALTEETVKSSAIEGEELNAESVRSSLARRMGLEVAGTRPADRNVEGIVEMMLDATQHYASALTEERIFGWHAALFPTGRSGMRKIKTGAWRAGGMEVVSGPEGKEKVHFEAPAANTLEAEMKRFLVWFEDSRAVNEPLIKAGLAHLYLVTIHPFEDGNGRIARAITEMSLARVEASAQRFYSMSSQIREERKAYYAILESTQKSGMDVTEWLIWFLDCLGRAIAKAKALTAVVLEKDGFWRRLREEGIETSDRQKQIINLLLGGFEGKLTTEKWAKLAKTSHDTALRDIQDLMEKGILRQDKAGGRSTAYMLLRERVG